MVDTEDSKSFAREGVRVRIPPRVLKALLDLITSLKRLQIEPIQPSAFANRLSKPIK